MLAQAGLEPPTFRFVTERATTELRRLKLIKSKNLGLSMQRESFPPLFPLPATWELGIFKMNSLNTS